MNHKQRTPEWFIARQGMITAGRLGSVMSMSDAYAKQLAMEREMKAAGLPPQMQVGDSPRTPAPLRWGHENEPKARAGYQFLTGEIIETCGFVVDKQQDYFGASPDGLIQHDGTMEIKCPMTREQHVEHTKMNIPIHYIWQMRGVMAATNRWWCDFVSYHPHVAPPLDLFVYRFHREMEHEEVFRHRLKLFNRLVESFMHGAAGPAETVVRLF